MANIAERAAAIDRVRQAVAGFDIEAQTAASQGPPLAPDPNQAADAIESTAASVKDLPGPVQ